MKWRYMTRGESVDMHGTRPNGCVRRVPARSQLLASFETLKQRVVAWPPPPSAVVPCERTSEVHSSTFTERDQLFFSDILLLLIDLRITGRIMTRPSNKSSHNKFSDRRQGTRRKDKDAASKKRIPEKPRGCRARGLESRHLVLGGCVLLIFVYTAMPSVPGGDSGELLASGCQFGIPHPPGERMGDGQRCCIADRVSRSSLKTVL